MYHLATYSSTSQPTQQTTHNFTDGFHPVQGDVTTVKQQLPTLSKTSTDIVPLESFGGMKVSDKPTTLPVPSSFRDEYSFAMAHDIDDDPLDLSEDFFGVVVPEHCGEKKSFEFRDFERDRASDIARGGYVPGDGCTAVYRSYEGDGVGHGGGTYHRFGRASGGLSPGYPTQEGMSKLIIDRMKDDQFRIVGGKSPVCLLFPFVVNHINYFCRKS